MQAKYTPQSIELFWNKVDKSNGPDACWIWTASRDRHGYGQVGINSKILRAHRVAYELTNGEIPPLTDICHACYTPPCCNPRHLFLGTRRENLYDMSHKGRRATGIKMTGCILTDAQVSEIRIRYSTKKETQLSIAKGFGVSISLVSQIVNYKRRA